MSSKIIIDAADGIVGRVASFTAKEALMGKEVIVVNCSHSVLTGTKRATLAKYKKARARGGAAIKGPHFPKSSERIMKRTIRGMLPYKKGRGEAAFKRIKCYIGIPEEFHGKKFETIVNANVKKLQSLKYTTVEQLCKLLR